jgi:hypothetical protein
MSRPALSNPIPTGVDGAKKEEGDEEGVVNLEDIIAEARRQASTEELRDANQEENFLPLSQMFELHPLGTGLGEKLQKGEQILEPVRLMNKLEPNLTKYERRIQEKREKEKRREMLLAQLVALHDHSKRLQEERQREQELEIRPHHHHQAASSGALVPFSTSSTSKGKDKAEVPPHPHLLSIATSHHLLRDPAPSEGELQPQHTEIVRRMVTDTCAVCCLACTDLSVWDP